MKRPTLVIALVVVGLLAAGAAFAARAASGGGSGSALAASTDDIFSSVSPSEQTTNGEERPWLGIRVVNAADGLTIAAVIADSPADKAGLQRGDIIIAVDGAQVDNMKALLTAIKDKKVGDSLTLSITRDGAAQDVTVTLEARPEPLREAHPLLPELNDIPRDELYSHMLGGEFRFTDKDNNAHTVSVDLGTVSAVDAGAGTITVDLNAGGTETYAVGEDVLVRPDDLTRFESGDRVTIISVDDNLRAITKGPGGGMFRYFGPGRGGPGIRGGGFGLFAPGDGEGFDLPDADGLDLPGRLLDRLLTDG